MIASEFRAPKQLEFEHGMLRCFRADDAEALQAAIHQSTESLRGLSPWVDVVQTPDDAASVISSCQNDHENNKNFIFGVFDHQNRLVGTCGFWVSESQLSERSVEIGGWGTLGMVGAGVATSAGIALMAWGFDAWPWQRIFALCNADNPQGRLLATRIGLQQEETREDAWDTVGRRRVDVIVYGASRDTWRRPLCTG